MFIAAVVATLVSGMVVFVLSASSIKNADLLCVNDSQDFRQELVQCG